MHAGELDCCLADGGKLDRLEIHAFGCACNLDD
jgi:hypothetical protein